ncbi:MAG: hypothetical protein SPE74_03850 [Oscillospiraceae bacterium]|nr:hypothetical protein [Oscillospiraceae bacterium]
MNFDQIKGIFNSVVDAVSEKGKEYAGTAAEKTKAAGRLARLTMELAGEKESLKSAYAAIGQTYFENNRQGAEGLLAQLCEEAETVMERIAAMEAEIAQLKAGFSSEEKDVDVTFEEIVEETEKEAGECCCGETADKLEDAADAVEEKIEDAVDTVEETMEEIREELDK